MFNSKLLVLTRPGITFLWRFQQADHLYIPTVGWSNLHLVGAINTYSSEKYK